MHGLVHAPVLGDEPVVDAAERRTHGRDDAGLLLDLAHGGLLGGLALLDVALGQRPQQPPAAIEAADERPRSRGRRSTTRPPAEVSSTVRMRRRGPRGAGRPAPGRGGHAAIVRRATAARGRASRPVRRACAPTGSRRGRCRLTSRVRISVQRSPTSAGPAGLATRRRARAATARRRVDAALPARRRRAGRAVRRRGAPAVPGRRQRARRPARARIGGPRLHHRRPARADPARRSRAGPTRSGTPASPSARSAPAPRGDLRDHHVPGGHLRRGQPQPGRGASATPSTATWCAATSPSTRWPSRCPTARSSIRTAGWRRCAAGVLDTPAEPERVVLRRPAAHAARGPVRLPARLRGRAARASRR